MKRCATSYQRYDKNQTIIVDNEEIKLIDYLKKLRIKKNITKKKISNLIKYNDYWYSQVERDGKKGDDNRQKTIYRDDLVDIISIIYYNATTSEELNINRPKSEIYIDKILKAIVLEGSVKPILSPSIYRGRTSEEQARLFHSLQNSLDTILKNIYNSYSGYERDRFLNTLKNVNTCLKIDSDFLMYILELPFADFLYEANDERIISLLSDIYKLIDDSSMQDLSPDKYKSMIIQKIKEDISSKYNINNTINKYEKP